MRQSLRFFDIDEFIGADISHAIRSKLNPVIPVLRISNEQPPSLLEVTKCPDDVSVGKTRVIEELRRRQCIRSALGEERKDVSLDLGQFVLIHDS